MFTKIEIRVTVGHGDNRAIESHEIELPYDLTTRSVKIDNIADALQDEARKKLRKKIGEVNTQT